MSENQNHKQLKNKRKKNKSKKIFVLKSCKICTKEIKKARRLNEV